MAVSPFTSIRYRLAARLLGVPASKANPVGGLISSMWSSGSPVYTSRSFEALAREGFENNGYIFRAISIIAQACAGIPWVLYRDKGSAGSSARRRTGGKISTTELDTHPLLDLLAHPHGQDTITGTASLVEAFVSYYVLSGNSYLTALRPTTRIAPPQELWVQQPGRMRVIPASDGSVSAYRYTVSGKNLDFAPEDVLHWRSFNPTDDWYGLSPVGVAARIVDQMNSANDWNTALLQNVARPSGFLVSQTTLTDPQYERLQLELKARYASAKNAGKPGLLEGGLSWQQVGLAPTDLDWLEGKKTNVREIAVILGVPSEMLGDSTNKTYSNYSEARRSFYTETVLPLMDVLRDLLNAWLVPMYGENGLRLDYDRDDIEALQEDRALVWTRAKESYAGGLLTLNEARDLLGYDATDEGDIFLTPPRELTLDQLLAGAALPTPPKTLPAVPPKVEPNDTPGTASPQLPPDTVTEAEKAYRRFQRKAKAASTQQQRDKWIDELTAQAQAQFQDEQGQLADILNNDDLTPDERVQQAEDKAKEFAAAWATLLAAAYASIGKAAGNALYAQWKADGLLPDEATYATEAANADTVIQDKADSISNYTADRLHSVLTDALAAGTTAALLAALSGEYDQWTGKNTSDGGGSRAGVVGVTEANTAWNAGMNDAATLATLHFDLVASQTWNAVMDARTRDEHAAANGQTVAMGETFSVGGEDMYYPGGGGDPANNINCRCWITYDGQPVGAED